MIPPVVLQSQFWTFAFIVGLVLIVAVVTIYQMVLALNTVTGGENDPEHALGGGERGSRESDPTESSGTAGGDPAETDAAPASETGESTGDADADDQPPLRD